MRCHTQPYRKINAVHTPPSYKQLPRHIADKLCNSFIVEDLERLCPSLTHIYQSEDGSGPCPPSNSSEYLVTIRCIFAFLAFRLILSYVFGGLICCGVTLVRW